MQIHPTAHVQHVVCFALWIWLLGNRSCDRCISDVAASFVYLQGTGQHLPLDGGANESNQTSEH